jgi:HD-GYP domain-containing protein (c-di-GMP phosphodiesterase class II)
MSKVRLDQGHVELDKALPFDLCNERGIILLKNGYVIRSKSQLDRLIDQGTYFEDINEEFSKKQQETAEKVSIFLRVGELAGEFITLFEKQTPEYSSVLDIVDRIQELCGLDNNAVLANLQLLTSGKYSLRHSFQTALLTEILLRTLNRPAEVRRYAIAGALTMNIGMLALQDDLYSQKLELTLEQKRTMIAHPQIATEMLRKAGIDHPVWLEVVDHHHEMIDGSGYPRKLKQSELSIESQAVSLADRYCAMIAKREYRAGLLPNIAASNLLNRQASTIDPAIAAAFSKEVGNHPPGTVVLLFNGEMAVVVKRLANASLPLVRSLRSSSGIRFPEPPKRNTREQAYAIKEALSSDAAKDFDLAILWSTLLLDKND